MHDGAGNPYDGDEAADAAILAFASHLSNVQAFDFPVERVKACALGYGWWVGAVRMSEAIRQLYQRRFDHESAPLIRTVHHHAGALVWLEQEPAAVIAAVEYEHPVEATRLFEHAQARGWDLSGLQQVPRRPSGPPPPGARFLRNFSELTQHIGKPNLYVPYKLESAYVHPSALSSETYLDLSDEGKVRGRQTARAPHTPLRATALALLVATEAFADLIGGNAPLTNLGAEVADELGFMEPH